MYVLLPLLNMPSVSHRYRYFLYTATFPGLSLSLFNPSFRLIVNHRLGQGGFGEVYLCHHRASGSPYALKVLEHSDEVPAYPIARECRIAKSLKHVSNINIYIWFDVSIL